MPAKLHAKDFPHWNGDAKFNAQMDRAFDYYRTFDPDFDTKLQEAHDKGYYLMDNSRNNPLLDPAKIGGKEDLRGQDLHLNITDNKGIEHPTIAINMGSALLVTVGGVITGIESVASAIYHELFSHGLNADNSFQLRLIDPDYGTFNERVAVGTDTLENTLSGEPNRDNHGGTEVWTSDVTMHTIMLEDGIHLVRMGANGKPEYGPLLDTSAPGWQHLDNAFKGQQQLANSAAGTVTLPNGSTVTKVGVNGHLADDYYVLHDTNGSPWLFHLAPTLPTPGPDAPVIILDPQNGNQTDQDPDDAPPPWAQGGGGNSGGGDCVACESYLPDGRRAGDIEVGDTMELADQNTLERGSGVVSFSRGKFALGYRITTESGASLVCSDTAPIPVKDRGLMTPDCLLGEQVAVRWDEGGITAVRWEKVMAVEEVGRIAVQHITVGDKCFWAGEKKGAYILHHNQKNGNDYGYGSSGTDNNNPWWWNDDASGESTKLVADDIDNNATPHTPGHDVPIVGVPVPDAGILM